jgi:MFS-type transporter involved in bile tolerance (Atg22 family)
VVRQRCEWCTSACTSPNRPDCTTFCYYFSCAEQKRRCPDLLLYTLPDPFVAIQYLPPFYPRPILRLVCDRHRSYSLSSVPSFNLSQTFLYSWHRDFVIYYSLGVGFITEQAQFQCYQTILDLLLLNWKTHQSRPRSFSSTITRSNKAKNKEYVGGMISVITSALCTPTTSVSSNQRSGPVGS